jgi:hypothetical protein
MGLGIMPATAFHKPVFLTDTGDSVGREKVCTKETDLHGHVRRDAESRKAWQLILILSNLDSASRASSTSTGECRQVKTRLILHPIRLWLVSAGVITVSTKNEYLLRRSRSGAEHVEAG